MLYTEIIDNHTFYQNFTPTAKLKCYQLQSKIIISATLIILFEDVLLKTPEELKKMKREISKKLDDFLYSDTEIMFCARIYDREQQPYFAGISASLYVNKLRKINKAMAQGSLESVLKDFEDVLYGTYIRPLSHADNESYFLRSPWECLKYKEIFLKDYLNLINEMRSQFVK